MRRQNASGANIVAQIALRGNGVIMAWQGTVHPFRFKPAWNEIIDLPWAEQLAKLNDPAFKKRMIEEENVWPESRSEEQTSELKSLMRISYAVFCLKKTKKKKQTRNKKS